MSVGREWMYNRFNKGALTDEFLVGLESFIEFACGQVEWMDEDKIRCPCNHRGCRNRKYLSPEDVRFHVSKNGFLPNYYVWNCHGENDLDTPGSQNNNEDMGPAMDYHTMVMDAAGPRFEPSNMEESPNPDDQKFYDMLDAADRDLWPGCTNHSQLSFIARMMHLKFEHHMSERNFDDVMQLISEILPQEHTVPMKFYGTKKLLRGMGLPLIKIDCCNNGCMIYWGEDGGLLCCKICGHPRFEGASQGDVTQPKKKIVFKRMYYFPLTDRLKRLYASTATANEMRWHGEHEMENGVMQHCSESLAWKHFNNTHQEFAAEVRNVRLCLSTDGFQPFS